MVYPVSSRVLVSISVLIAFVSLSNTLTAQCGTVVHIDSPSHVFCNSPGSAVTLSAKPIGGVFTGQAIRGDGRLQLDKLTAGSYWMHYTAPDSCATKDSVEIHVQHVDSDISQLNPFNCADNRPSLLQVVATSNETLILEGLDWTLNVQPGEFETQSLPHANTYRLEVANYTLSQSCIAQVQPAYINPTRLQTRTNLDCQADSLSIVVVGHLLPAVTTWRFYDDFAFAKTATVDTGFQLSPKQVGHYQLEATYSNGCQSEKSIWVPLVDSFMPQVSLPARLLMPCTNNAISLPCQITTGEDNGRPFIRWISDRGQGFSDSSVMTPTVDQIGTYTVHVTDSTSGCTTAPVSVRVSQAGPQNDTVHQAICHDTFYDWEGRRHRQSGVYGRSFQNSFGCDSNRVLVLEVLAKAQDTLDMSTCAGSFIAFGGDSLRTTGLFTKTFSSIHGCDSVVTVRLKVTAADSYVYTRTICAGERLQFGSEILSESGRYNRSFKTAAGCDSIIELTLEVIPEIRLSISPKICEGDSYSFGNRQLYTTGQYVDTFTAKAGCDSVVTLNLEVIPTSNTDIVAIICEGEAYELSGQSFTETGLYTLAFGAANGCDSLYNLDLSVTPPMELKIDTINRSSSSVGDLVVRVEGGVAPYRFQWSNGANDDNVPYGTVVTSVEVFDANGCGQVLILESSSATTSTWARELTLGPNPTHGSLQWTFTGERSLSQVEVRNAQGQLIEHQILSSQSQGELDLINFPAGFYVVEFESLSGQKHTIRIVRL